MKKLMILALMMLGTSAVFAGDSDALKAVLKADTYAEAKAALQQNLNAMANNAEKAKAYAHLVDISWKEIAKGNAIQQNNQLVQQMKVGKVEALDSVPFYDAICDALADASECDKYDIQPDEKGKVKPKYHEKNSARLWSERIQLVIGGQAFTATNKEKAKKYFESYVESGQDPMFKDVDRTKQPDTYEGQVARVSAIFAYQNKEMDKAMKYVNIAIADTASFKEALPIKLALEQLNLKTHADSVKFAGTVKDLYQKDAKNDDLFATLFSLYVGLGKSQEMSDLVESRLAKDPNNFLALANKGVIYMNKNDAPNAIIWLKKAVAVQQDNARVYKWLGDCLNVLGANEQDAAKQKAYFTESVSYLEKAKELDPGQHEVKWAYAYYSACYGAYGANDQRTKDAEALTK